MSFKMASVVKLRRDQDGEWFKCPYVTAGDFEVRINFLDSDEWTKLLAKAKKPDGKTVDDEKLARLIADTSVSGWRGLTKEAMLELFPGMEPEQVEQIPESGIPADAETKYVLLREQSDVFRWISKLSNDRAAYVEARKDSERKN
mgnify:CR=1 FL=1